MSCLVVVGAPWGLVACIDGKTPPAATARVTIKGSFMLGKSVGYALACDATKTEIERCDVGSGGSDFEAYAGKLSWVPTVAVDLPAFAIDITEVTNEQYAFCVDSEACTAPVYQGINSVADYYGGKETAKHPVVWVSHKQAREYCAFVGGALPTEAQWEAAARYRGDDGGAEDRAIYPWPGSRPVRCEPPGHAEHVPFRGCHGPHAVGTSAKDKTPRGVYDLASNVREWVGDGWDAGARCGDPACSRQGKSCGSCGPNGCAVGCDGVDLCTPRARYQFVAPQQAEWVVRGGSYKFDRCFHRIFVRQRDTVAHDDLGFRCAFVVP